MVQVLSGPRCELPQVSTLDPYSLLYHTDTTPPGLKRPWPQLAIFSKPSSCLLSSHSSLSAQSSYTAISLFRSHTIPPSLSLTPQLIPPPISSLYSYSQSKFVTKMLGSWWTCCLSEKLYLPDGLAQRLLVMLSVFASQLTSRIHAAWDMIPVKMSEDSQRTAYKHASESIDGTQVIVAGGKAS